MFCNNLLSLLSDSKTFLLGTLKAGHLTIQACVIETAKLGTPCQPLL